MDGAGTHESCKNKFSQHDFPRTTRTFEPSGKCYKTNQSTKKMLRCICIYKCLQGESTTRNWYNPCLTKQELLRLQSDQKILWNEIQKHHFFTEQIWIDHKSMKVFYGTAVKHSKSNLRKSLSIHSVLVLHW